MSVRKSLSGGVTLAQVARIAGVSDITVSRVLRANVPVSAETRDRVLEAVQATGYVHNRLAGALASAHSNLVGVVLPSLSNNVFPEVMEGINAALARSGYQPVVGVTNYDLAVEQELIHAMLAWKPAALILTGLEHTREADRMLEGSGIRVIEIMDIDERPIDLAIGLSHRKAGAAVARHLIAKGYRRFGYVGHDLRLDRRAAARRQGFYGYLAEQGLYAPIEHLTGGPSSIRAGSEGLRRLLEQTSDCDVVVFSNDDMAVGGVFHCLKAGIDLPAQLGIFGFNGLDIGQALPQPLSTIRSNRQRIGQLAVEAFLTTSRRPEEREIIDTGFEIIPGETA
ncbi:MAG TPA: LacI family DNA-binding transcriptional regulator [Devosiaceae bacterium]|jgi:LacI family gluconate utilization system Gnt-I transcriptional repressor